MTVTPKELAEMMQAISAWSCENKLPIIVFGINDKQIFSIDHTDCEGIPDITNMIIKRVSQVMKDEIENAYKELFGRDPSITTIIAGPITKKQN